MGLDLIWLTFMTMGALMANSPSTFKSELLSDFFRVMGSRLIFFLNSEKLPLDELLVINRFTCFFFGEWKD